MSRLVISGEYAPDWSVISFEARAKAGFRCVRCRHRFDAETGRPFACDEQCDPRRGRTRCFLDSIALRIGTALVPQVHSPEVPGLNYGVHHLDGNKGNNAWWNLLPLCNSCHLSVQASVIPERPYLFEHSAWFVPFVCGYYAAQAGMAITRADALAHPEAFLAMGQPWLREARA